ncbi:Panacea domain-containing protein [Xenorhabdus littoralis]|uniref:Panacea domain-containing protein n=1 Tax=Xenorhabdus littoralis TaxID=2582835 RepID=UPI0029E81FFF|nr:Panacea domain-containing protein [Xenorhabdus sp. psl]MDX7993207.1 DUF4065 domain-containing protein [Xenorhabdus sp. psl]
MAIMQFDSEKALEAILYVASSAPNPDVYHIGKILYFADRKHLECYGRLITGDSYRAMKNGPVASGAYDILKIARGDKLRYFPSGCNGEYIKSSLEVANGDDNHRVSAKRGFDPDFFSKSDLKCLNEAIHEYGRLSFKELNDISHDEVWKAANTNDEIPLEVIALHCKDGEYLVEYLHS